MCLWSVRPLCVVILIMTSWLYDSCYPCNWVNSSLSPKSVILIVADSKWVYKMYMIQNPILVILFTYYYYYKWPNMWFICMSNPAKGVLCYLLGFQAHPFIFLFFLGLTSISVWVRKWRLVAIVVVIDLRDLVC